MKNNVTFYETDQIIRLSGMNNINMNFMIENRGMKKYKMLY